MRDGIDINQENEQVLGFKIWYPDGAITGDTYAEWLRAPTNNVQSVAVYFATQDHEGKHLKLVSFGRKTYSLNDKLHLNKRTGHRKTGTNIANDKFQGIMQETEKDNGEDWIMPGFILKQTPDYGGKMIDIPSDRNTHSKTRGSK